MAFMVDRDDLIHAIIGYGVPMKIVKAKKWEELWRHTGNQWNENWEWWGARLDNQTDGVLLAILEDVKK